MAPEQGPDSKSQREKKETVANEKGSAQNYESSKHDHPTTSQSLNKDSVGWIYLLRKEQLIEQCNNAGIPTAGFTVEHLRKQLAENLRAKRLRASAENLLLELEKELTTAEKSIICEGEISLAVPRLVTAQKFSDFDIMNIVQRWNLKFSGETDVIEFLERLEELADCHQICPDQLLPCMISMLSGNALKWFRVKRETINTWQSFRQELERFFLPTRYLANLERNFYSRKQNNRERAKDYILSMLTLCRRHPTLRKINHLDRIYDGLRTEYRYYVRRNDFTDLDELIAMTDEYEALKQEERSQTSHMNCRILPQPAVIRADTHPPLHTITSRGFLSEYEKDELNNPLREHDGKGLGTVDPTMMQIINEEIDKPLDDDRIETQRSAYSAPIELARKKHSGWITLNTAIKPDAYPLPQINAIRDQLRETKLISSLDLKHGYWQPPLKEPPKPYTALTVPGRGLFQWRVTPFMLHSAPATFQRKPNNKLTYFIRSPKKGGNVTKLIVTAI